VAAHSTTRALFDAYNGPLYQVRRSRDNAVQDIGLLRAGGTANAAAQDSFCSGTTCVISIIYDQTGRRNHLTQAPPGGFNGPAAGGFDNLANATAAPITIGGNRAYGVFVAPGTGYRNNATSGIATGSASQGVYMVAAGGHVNSGCCFDYGNAETSSRDTGNGHMGAVYFGTLCWFGGVVAGQCVGSGPWVMADLENGLFAGANGTNTNNTGRNSTFVTGMLKMNSTTYALKDGNANSGGRKTSYNGPLPTTSGYTPLHLEGAIILGIGGDNSNGSAGTFYEGVMTSGFPSDATENAVQANIVAAGYGQAAGGTRTGAIHSGVNVPSAWTTTTQPRRQATRYSCLIATASPPRRAGPSTATEPSPSTVAAWISPETTPPTAPSSNGGPATAVRTSSGRRSTDSWSIRPPANAWTTPPALPPMEYSSRYGPAAALRTSNGACRSQVDPSPHLRI
jgi:hypothetical protein